jgi:phosphohistidine phosphatase
MKRTLVLMRHAKSDWSNPSFEDSERTLNSRGRNDAPLVGNFMYDLIGTPDQILCSEAVRARETAKLVAESLNYKRNIIIEPQLYDSYPAVYLKVISKIADDIKTLLIVGHNPIIEQLISILSANRPNDMSVHVSTSGVACFTVDNRSWSDIETGSWDLKWLVTPKLIKKKKRNDQ